MMPNLYEMVLVLKQTTSVEDYLEQFKFNVGPLRCIDP